MQRVLSVEQTADTPKRHTAHARSSCNRRGQGLVEQVLILALVSATLVLVLLVFRNQIGNGLDGAAQSLHSTSGISSYVPGGGTGAVSGGGNPGGNNGRGRGRGRGGSGGS